MEFLVLAVGVAFIVVAIAVLKVHPFIALIIAGFVVGILSPQPLDLKERLEMEKLKLSALLESGSIDESGYQERLRQASTRIRNQGSQQKGASQGVQALEYTAREFGSTAASIGIVIVLAAIIGQCLMESGAADKITRKLLQLLGQKRAPLSLMGSGYFLSVPVFFDTVFFLLIPLARALRMRTKKDYVIYVMAIAGGAVVSHSLVPPTPGPLIMVENFSVFGLDLGTALLVGFLLGVIPAVMGLIFAGFVNRRFNIPLREALGSSRSDLEKIIDRDDSELPSLGLSILPVISPVLLIAGNTVLNTIHEQHLVTLPESVLAWSEFAGNKNFALLFGTVCAIALLLRQLGLSLGQLRDRLEPAIMSAGVIILITSAGGAFGKMLSRIGIAEALQGVSGAGALTGIALIFLAWGLSSLMKIAQGSGTVAMITASAMMASIIGETYSLSYHPIYLYAAIGFGSLFISWMNDSAFWVICKMSGFTEKETLTTWTAMMAILGVVGLLEVVLFATLLPLA